MLLCACEGHIDGDLLLLDRQVHKGQPRKGAADNQKKKYEENFEKAEFHEIASALVDGQNLSEGSR
jgi:hypothetical protein